MPYLLVGALLVITRIPETIRSFLDGCALSSPGLLGTEISAVANPLKLPGTVFLIVAVLCVPLHRMGRDGFAAALRESGRATLGAAVAIVFAVPMVQIFILSGENAAGLPSMPRELAEAAAYLAQESWPAVSAVIGALGAFVAGSNTISNMTFSLFQFEVGLRVQLSPVLMVALQAVPLCIFGENCA